MLAQIRALSRWSKSPTLRQIFTRRHNSSGPKITPGPDQAGPEPVLSLSQRMRKLSREYGWSALGVYLLLSALDFPFCFLGVRWLGTEKIGHWEHVVVETFWKVVPWPFPATEGSTEGSTKGPTETGPLAETGPAEGDSWGVEEAERANRGETASIWTQLALAYAIHKSFIFIRVPLTAAVTPKVVRVLRGWGWDIGKRQGKIPKISKDN